MIYEISLKIKVKNERTELSYYEVWRAMIKTFLPYEKPIIGVVFRHEHDPRVPSPEPSDRYIVLVEAESSSTKAELKAFVEGRNLIREKLSALDTPVFLVYGDKE